MNNFNIITLFPEFFTSPLSSSLMGKAVQNDLINFTFINPRDFSISKHRQVDDSPYGGGPGMVMQLAPLCSALRTIKHPGKILLMSPCGKSFTQSFAQKLAEEKNLTLICGRYEGIDFRLNKLFPIEEISICDAILNGGETAALAIIEAVCRLLPGFMGKEESREQESFCNFILEYPQYTRPENFEGMEVPKILLSGNHEAINTWRKVKSLEKTLDIRPDLLTKANLCKEEADILSGLPHTTYGKNISFCLLHYPVWLDEHKKGTSSLTNLDIHDIARISRSYGMGPFYVLMPFEDQLNILNSILEHWLNGSTNDHKDRARALQLTRPIKDFAELDTQIKDYYGKEPIYIVTSANWPKEKEGDSIISPCEILSLSENNPVIICLGTAKGLDLKSLPFKFCQVRPLRFLNDNHLSVRSAAAILADRILGDFY